MTTPSHTHTRFLGGVCIYTIYTEAGIELNPHIPLPWVPTERDSCCNDSTQHPQIGQQKLLSRVLLMSFSCAVTLRFVKSNAICWLFIIIFLWWARIGFRMYSSCGLGYDPIVLHYIKDTCFQCANVDFHFNLCIRISAGMFTCMRNIKQIKVWLHLLIRHMRIPCIA